MRWGPGPVFVYECVTNAHRWQTYAARSFRRGFASFGHGHDRVVEQRDSARGLGSRIRTARRVLLLRI